jgi:hypothetical protein
MTLDLRGGKTDGLVSGTLLHDGAERFPRASTCDARKSVDSGEEWEEEEGGLSLDEGGEGERDPFSVG